MCFKLFNEARALNMTIFERNNTLNFYFQNLGSLYENKTTYILISVRVVCNIGPTFPSLIQDYTCAALCYSYSYMSNIVFLILSLKNMCSSIGINITQSRVP